jgi:hypothetical protein
MNNIKTNTVVVSPLEKQINSYKLFYLKYLLKHKEKRLQILNELNPLLGKFQNYQGRSIISGDSPYFLVETNIKSFLEKYWDKELLDQFNKNIPYERSKRKTNPFEDDGFLMGLLVAIGEGITEQHERVKATINYKINFLNFLRNCLMSQGLHSFISQRDERIYKRFNLHVTFKENRKDDTIAITLLSQNELESDYLAPFYKGKQIFVHGKIIKASSISKLIITTTLLWHDDEIELFGHSRGFTWNRNKKDEIAFSLYCYNETNAYLKNPNAETPKKPFKNNSITYIEQSRIDELAGIKSKKYDTSKLISLCLELNQCSTIGSVIAVAGLQRTIINHVPPIFGYNDFGQVVAQYNTGKSRKYFNWIRTEKFIIISNKKLQNYCSVV